MDPLLVGLLFALLVSAAFAFIERDTPAERRRYFIKAFLYFFLSILLAGWAMRFLPL